MAELWIVAVERRNKIQTSGDFEKVNADRTISSEDRQKICNPAVTLKAEDKLACAVKHGMDWSLAESDLQ